MNCLSSEYESFCQSDLVFFMSGGAYSGKALPIKTQKCILAFDSNSGSPQRSRCAIFRGEAGVTVRNLDRRVLVNGEVRNEHWLKKGDRIEFPNSIILEVHQLGCNQGGIDWPSQQPVMTESVSPVTEFSFSEPDHSLTESRYSNASPESRWVDDHQSPDFSSSAESATNSTSSMQSEVSADVLSCVENRFHDIEERLNQLSEQISSLVTLASCGRLSTTALPESDWQKQVNNASIAALLPTPAILENDDSVVTETATIVPTSRFNVAEYFPASDPAKSAQTIEETNQLDVPLASTPEKSAVVDIDALVPNRRVPNELQNLVLENEATVMKHSVAPLAFSDAGLSELMASLSEKEGTLIQKTSRDVPELETLSGETEGVAKFSTADAIEATSTAAIPPAAGTVIAPHTNGDRVTKSAAVDDEIDRLLSRLFDAKSLTTPQPSNDSNGHQTANCPNQLLESGVESPNEAKSVNSPQADLIDFRTGTQSEISYANMQFGYELSPNENSLDKIDPAGGFNASNETPLTEAVTSTNPANTLADDEDTSENLMDLLARLKQEEFLHLSENDSTDPCTIQAVNGAAETSTVETEQSNPGDQVETPTAKPATVATDSVEDYMNQLLARMNLGTDSHLDAKSKERTNSSNALQAQAALDDCNRSSELITAEEYVPKQKPAKIESLETMREIANTTARSAVEFSNLDRRKARGLMQTVIGIGALIMAAYYFLFVSEAFADTAFVVGLICLLITGGAGYMAFNTFKGTGILKDLFPQAKRDQ